MLPLGTPVIVGMTEAGAEQHLRTMGYTIRCTNRDNCPLPVLADVRPDRINVVIENGMVVAISGVG